EHLGHAIVGRVELRQSVDDARVGHLEDAAVAAQQRIAAQCATGSISVMVMSSASGQCLLTSTRDTHGNAATASRTLPRSIAKKPAPSDGATAVRTCVALTWLKVACTCSSRTGQRSDAN